MANVSQLLGGAPAVPQGGVHPQGLMAGPAPQQPAEPYKVKLQADGTLALIELDPMTGQEVVRKVMTAPKRGGRGQQMSQAQGQEVGVPMAGGMPQFPAI